MPDLNIRSVRPRAYRILKAAGLKIGTSRAGALPRHRAGVRSVAVLHGPRVSTTGSGSGELAAYLADAIAALRAAGWTVSDDGTIRVVPGMQP